MNARHCASGNLRKRNLSTAARNLYAPRMYLVCFRNRVRAQEIASCFGGTGVAVHEIEKARDLMEIYDFEAVVVDQFAGGNIALAMVEAAGLAQLAPVVIASETCTPGEIVLARACGAIGVVRRDSATIASEVRSLVDEYRRNEPAAREAWARGSLH